MLAGKGDEAEREMEGERWRRGGAGGTVSEVMVSKADAVYFLPEEGHLTGA